MKQLHRTVPGRDRYLDLLRALALVRVVAFHTFGAGWLTMVFPAMGVMFALAGSLMANSLARPAPGVLLSRTRRLLPPLWAYSAIVLVLLAVWGWRPWEDGVSWTSMLLWFVPIGEPPTPAYLPIPTRPGEEWLAEELGGLTTVVLWYIRTYFWLMLLSPLLLWAYRRAAWVTLVAPLALVAFLELGVVEEPTWGSGTLWNLATYGACWVLGFAHRDGSLQALRLRTVVILAAASMTAGMLWFVSHPGEGWLDLNESPLAQALWSLGFVAVLLRLSPSWSALPDGLRALDRPITLLNNRAITVYLWHYLLLLATYPVVDLLWNSEGLSSAVPWLLESEWPSFVLVWVFLAITVLVVGWVEDVAARRSLRWWPDAPPLTVR